MKYSVSILICVALTMCHAASFDCKNAVTSVEKSICANQQLSTLDSTLGFQYAQLKKKLTKEEVAILKDEQFYWITIRNKAINTNNAENVYRNRINDLILKLKLTTDTSQLYSGTFIVVHKIIIDDNEKPAADCISIVQQSNNEINFRIRTIGTNANECDIEGLAKGTGGKLEWVDPDNASSPCKLYFEISKNKIVIKNLNISGCSSFCGAGMSIDKIELNRINAVSGTGCANW